MKVLICCSRGINDPTVIEQAIAESGMIPRHIVSGGAGSVDSQFNCDSAIPYSETRRKKTKTHRMEAHKS